VEDQIQLCELGLPHMKNEYPDDTHSWDWEDKINSV
jgi:hypothetical protein